MIEVKARLTPRVWRAVLDSAWACEIERLRALVDVVESRMHGGFVASPETIAAVRAQAPAVLRSGSVAVVPLFGTIFDRANIVTEMSGGTTLQAWIPALRAAVNDPEVSAVVLDVDSPGGSSTGVLEAADAVFAMRGKKPIVAVANKLAASAAYWLASQADEIVASPSAEVGSIGVYGVHEDRSRANEAEGVTVTYIQAGRLKTVGNPDQPLDDEGRAVLQARVEAVYVDFVAGVARGRGVEKKVVRSDTWGEGRVIGAREAARVGMVDRVATIDEVVEKLSKRGSAARGRAAAARIAINSASAD